MNPSNYMDKEITQLSKHRRRFLADDEEEEDDQDDFAPHSVPSFHYRMRSSHGSEFRGQNPIEDINSTEFSGEKFGSIRDIELISKIDQKLKEHVDVLLHSVERLSARVSQMESRTRKLEDTFDNLKEAIDFSHGTTDRKLRELENMMIEVRGGIKDLRDRQEIAEAQVQLEKLRVSKDEQQPEKQNKTVQLSSGAEALSSVPQQPASCPQPVLAFSSNFPNLTLQNHSPTTPVVAAPQVPIPSASYLPTVVATETRAPSPLPQNIFPPVTHQGAYQPLPVSTPGTIQQQYVPPTPTQHPQIPVHAHQPYQPPPNLPLNSLVPQLPQVHSPFTWMNPQVYRQEEVPYVPSSQGINRYPQPHEISLPSQSFNTVPASQPSKLQYSNFAANSPAQGQPHGYSNVADFYHYAAHAHNSSSTAKLSQPSPAPSGNSGEMSYSRLPTSRVLQHAIPTADIVESESSSSGNENKVPVDDVIDRIVGMGFRRDVVRATVKKLTENGQPVDLNIVLDKLMNNG